MKIGLWIYGVALLAGILLGPAALEVAASTSPPLGWADVSLAFAGSAASALFVVGLALARPGPDESRSALRFFGPASVWFAASGVSAAAVAFGTVGLVPHSLFMLALGSGLLLGVAVCYLVFRWRFTDALPMFGSGSSGEVLTSPVKGKRWGRNVAVAVFVVVVAVVLVHYSIEKSDAFETASSFLRTNAEVVRSVGRVENTSLSWGAAKMESSGNRGSAKFTVNIRGVSGSAQAYVELNKRDSWEVLFVRLLIGSNEPIVIQEVK